MGDKWRVIRFRPGAFQSQEVDSLEKAALLVLHWEEYDWTVRVFPPDDPREPQP
jgi:hypothetical protein